MPNDDFTIISVDKPFPLQLSGDLFFRILGGKPSFILNIDNPTKQELKAFNGDSIELSIYQRGDLSFLLAKLGLSWPWMDVPIHAAQNHPQELQHFYDAFARNNADTAVPFCMYLVDAVSHKTKAMRILAPSYSFEQKIVDIFHEQEKEPVSLSQYNYRVAALYRVMSSEQMTSLAQERFVLRKR